MREIEFKAKCQLKGKWMYGYYRVSGGKHYINSTLIHPETVGQYTGLKDKNGQKIYEGDVIKSKKYLPDIVEFGDGVFYPFNQDDYCLSSDEYEVIGNIHEKGDS